MRADQNVTTQGASTPSSRPGAPLPPGALTQLDWIRGLAAFSVLAGHVRGLFFVDYSDLEAPSRVEQVAYMATGLGHQAVIVFFVLSGFFIGYSVLIAHKAERFDGFDYSIRRFSRLYAVLVPALLITFLVDKLGIALFGSTGNVYGGDVNAPFLELPNIANQLGVVPLLGNLFQLQSITSMPEFGSNGPLWSLPYEAWAYVLFPLGVAVVRKPASIRSLAGGALCVAIFWAANRLLFLYFGIWLLGAAVARWWIAKDRTPDEAGGSAFGVVVALAAFTALAVIGRGRMLSSRALEDILLGLATAGLIVALLRSRRSWNPSRSAKAATWLAGFSYSLYLFHYPMGSAFL
ncbi:MAG: acyltransferase [Polyangiaceae bacterium]|nr:acyltransferase [Polyangiaceae bacterium]